MASEIDREGEEVVLSIIVRSINFNINMYASRKVPNKKRMKKIPEVMQNIEKTPKRRHLKAGYEPYRDRGTKSVFMNRSKYVTVSD